MIDQLKPLSREERETLNYQWLAASNEEDYARLGQYIPRTLLTIAELEQDRDRWQKQAEEWDQYTHDLEVQREKLVDALKLGTGYKK